MRIIVAAVTFSAVAVSAAAGPAHVHGYVKKDGTYVAPHERTTPDNTKLNNYSTKGNVNPYTGKEGAKDPALELYRVQPVSPAPSAQSGAAQSATSQTVLK